MHRLTAIKFVHQLVTSALSFNALLLLVARWEWHLVCKKTERWDAGVVICLERGADMHIAQLMPLPLTISCSSKSRLVLPFWYQFSQIVLDTVPLNECLLARSQHQLAKWLLVYTLSSMAHPLSLCLSIDSGHQLWKNR